MKQITLLTLFFFGLAPMPQLYSYEMTKGSPDDPDGSYLKSCTCHRNPVTDSSGDEYVEYACDCTINHKSVRSTKHFPKNYCSDQRHLGTPSNFNLDCMDCTENDAGKLECKVQTAH